MKTLILLLLSTTFAFGQTQNVPKYYSPISKGPGVSGFFTGLPTVLVDQLGAVGNGTTDDSAAILAAVNEVVSLGGGTVYFSCGKTYRMNSQFALPSAWNVKQAPIKLQGCLSSWPGLLTDNNNNGVTTLDLRYNGTVAKLLTVGEGLLEITGFDITDNGTSSLPFIYTTSTTLKVHDNHIIGNPSKGQLTADQDAFVFGGTTITASADPTTSPFQGYGTVIERNLFSRIHSLGLFRVAANAIIFQNNSSDLTCGADNSAAAFMLDGTKSVGASEGNEGNVFANNLIEMQGYIYGAWMKTSIHNSFIGNGWFDSSVSGPRQLVAIYRTTFNSYQHQFNHIFGGYMEQSAIGFVSVDDDGFADDLIGTDAYGRYVGTQAYWSYSASTTLFGRAAQIQITNPGGANNTWEGVQFNSPDATIAGGWAFQNIDITNHYASWSATSRGPLGFTSMVFNNANLCMGTGIGNCQGTFTGALYQAGTVYSAAGTPLPTCTSGLRGTRAMVSDATTPTYLANYVSGGATVAPVYCTGSFWVTG